MQSLQKNIAPKFVVVLEIIRIQRNKEGLRTRANIIQISTLVPTNMKV